MAQTMLGQIAFIIYPIWLGNKQNASIERQPKDRVAEVRAAKT